MSHVAWNFICVADPYSGNLCLEIFDILNLSVIKFFNEFNWVTITFKKILSFMQSMLNLITPQFGQTIWNKKYANFAFLCLISPLSVLNNV